MKILIKNCNLISMSDSYNKLEKQIDILIEDNKIKQIERDIQLNEEELKVINADGKYVMPGLINAHAHIGMSIFRETVDGYSTQEWLEKKIWPMEDKMTKSDIYYASILSCIEMIKTGTTTVNDMYFMTEETIDAALKIGIRLQTTRTLMDVSDNGEGRIKELNELIEKYNQRYDTISLNVGIHGLYTNSSEYIKKGINIAKKYSLPIHMHFCENEQEVQDIKQIYNVNMPTNVLEKYFNDTHNILAHAVKVSDEEIRIMSKINVNIAHCPISNLKLGCGIANIVKMQENNINISLGTDGQGSGCNLDMFDTMKFTALLQKGINENAKDMQAYEIIKMATINGAKALKLDYKIGSIQEGNIADLIILDLKNVVTQPINDIFATIVYNTKGTNVETTIINGKIVMEDRKIDKINEEEIYSKAEDIINRIKVDIL